MAHKLRSLCMRDIRFLCICSLDVFGFAPACYKPFVTVVVLVVWGRISLQPFRATVVFSERIYLERRDRCCQASYCLTKDGFQRMRPIFANSHLRSGEDPFTRLRSAHRGPSKILHTWTWAVGVQTRVLHPNHTK